MRPFVAVVALFLVSFASSGSAKVTAERCGGRFMIMGAPVIVGDPDSAHGPVVVEGGRVSIGASCRRVKGRVKVARWGQAVRARWRGCSVLRGVRFEAAIASDCSIMVGVLRTRLPRTTQTFTALRSSCGDGMVDDGAGEHCDGGGCGEGQTCTACRCVDIPVTTSTVTTTSTTTSTTSTIEPPATTTTVEATTTTNVTSTTSSTSTTDPLPTTTTTSSTTSTTVAPRSVARQWDEELLDAIRRDLPRPPVHARNLFHMSVAMWDAWAAYDGTAAQYLAAERATATDVEAARAEAISFAAYRVVRERYAHSAGAAVALAAFDARMDALGYDRNFISTDGDTPAALGNRIAALVLQYGYTDGCNEGPLHTYQDPTYGPVNPPLLVKLPLPALNATGGGGMVDPDRWQALALDHFVSQNGIPEPITQQTFVGSQWGAVTPFALVRTSPGEIYLDPGPPPAFGSETYRDGAVDLIRKASLLTPDDPTLIDISPGAMWNNPLGTNDGIGHTVNPVTGQPYAPNIVKRGDWARVLAEFWADGPKSETPPGHWNVLANEATDRIAAKRLGGTGPVLNALEWDVKLYFALNGAVHDAAIGAWGTKRRYDSSRPITAIRYLSRLGQSSDPSSPRYHPDGLPLIPGLIELITAQTTAAGQRHARLAGFEGEIAILAWPGQPAIPLLQYSGAQWVLGRKWVTYQANTFVTPPFAGYTSGHSTYSRAAAEVLTAFTGSPYVPGGLGQFVARRNAYLLFELGPSQDIVLQWATYYDAADQAGVSRLWGGIHPFFDDFPGRVMGSRIGLDAFALAARYFDGTVAP